MTDHTVQLTDADVLAIHRNKKALTAMGGGALVDKILAQAPLPTNPPEPTTTVAVATDNDGRHYVADPGAPGSLRWVRHDNSLVFRWSDLVITSIDFPGF